MEVIHHTKGEGIIEGCGSLQVILELYLPHIEKDYCFLFAMRNYLKVYNHGMGDPI